MTKGDRIKELREKKNMTQEELAIRLNTTKQTISKYEKNIVTNIPSDKIEELCRVLNCDPNYILEWESMTKEGQKISDIKINIADRLDDDKSFLTVASFLNSLDEEEFIRATELLNLSFKVSLDKVKD